MIIFSESTALVCVLALSQLAVIAHGAEPNVVWFESPAEGTTVRPGDTVIVEIAVDEALNADRVLLAGSVEPGHQELLGPPFRAAVVIPANWSGPLALNAAATSTSDEWYGMASITLNVVPADSPMDIQVLNQGLTFTLPGGALSSQRIMAFGQYADGHARSINGMAQGTTYESSDESIMTVDDEGYVYPLVPGVGYVSIRNGTAEAWVAVRVWDRTQGAGQAREITADVSISRSGFRIDPNSGLFVQQVIIANNSAEPLVLPIALVVEDLPPSVSVDNAAGKTMEIAPIGTPWLRVTADAEFLEPGASLSSEARFYNPDKIQITYVPRTYISTDP